ncbi:MAG: tetratricopeptide repeat protein, partial [Thermoanaerobaculia bacterium]
AAPPPVGASAEARLAETDKEWARAESLEASILRSHPDDLDATLRLASDQVAGGRAQEALRSLSVLDKLRAPARDDPRIDLARAEAFAALSKWRDELAASRAAAKKARRNESTRLLAEARLHEGGALRSLGDSSKGRSAYEAAADLFRRDGDSSGEAEALIGIANAVGNVGRDGDAEKLYRQAQATFERIGNRKGEARVLSDLADEDWLRGDADAALSEARQVLAINRDINDPRGIVWGLTATGNILADQGDFGQALALQQEGVGISRKLGDDGYLAYGLGSLADTFLAQGRLADAQRNYESALALATKLGDRDAQATHENDLGTVFSEEGDLPEADKHYGRALATRRALGEEDEAEESQMLIATVRNAQGRYLEADRLAKEAARVFAADRQTGNEAIALANQARAELGLEKIAAARSLCQRARHLLKENRQNGANLPVLVESVRIETSTSNPDEARKLLSDLEDRAGKARWPLYIFESRRAAAEIEFLAGERAKSLREFRSLADEARGAGFNLIAAQAQTFLARGKSAAP